MYYNSSFKQCKIITHTHTLMSATLQSKVFYYVISQNNKNIDGYFFYFIHYTKVQELKKKRANCFIIYIVGKFIRLSFAGVDKKYIKISVLWN